MQSAGFGVGMVVDPQQLEVAVREEHPPVPGALPGVSGSGVQDEAFGSGKQGINVGGSGQEDDQVVEGVHRLIRLACNPRKLISAARLSSPQSRNHGSHRNACQANAR